MSESTKLSESESAELAERISSLSRSGLPLVAGLIALGDELPRGPLRRSMTELAHALEAGVSLDEAIHDQESRLPPQLKGLVKAGLKTGRLGDLLARFSAYAGVGVELRRKLRLSLIYPVCSIVTALALFGFICMVVVPQFEEIFRDFGMQVPVLTRGLISISHVFRNAVMPLITVGLLCLLAWVFGLFLKPAVRRSLVCRIPVVGRVWRFSSLAEYFHLLALLLESEVPLPEAVRLAGDGVQNTDLERASGIAAQEVEAGHDLADAMAITRSFPGGFSRLLKWAEKPGSLSEVLHMIAEMFEARAQAQLTFAGAFLGFLSFIFVIWGGATVVIGLMLPMIRLLSRLSG